MRLGVGPLPSGSHSEMKRIGAYGPLDDDGHPGVSLGFPVFHSHPTFHGREGFRGPRPPPQPPRQPTSQPGQAHRIAPAGTMAGWRSISHSPPTLDRNLLPFQGTNKRRVSSCSQSEAVCPTACGRAVHPMSRASSAHEERSPAWFGRTAGDRSQESAFTARRGELCAARKVRLQVTEDVLNRHGAA